MILASLIALLVVLGQGVVTMSIGILLLIAALAVLELRQTRRIK